MATVLVADDHAEIRRLWAVNLQARKHRVLEAGNGRECLELLRSGRPDVILLDLTMPVLSGWEVLDYLATVPIHARVPVVVVTGWGDEEVVETAREKGACGTLVKPFDVEEMLRAVEHALGRDEREGMRGRDEGET